MKLTENSISGVIGEASRDGGSGSKVWEWRYESAELSQHDSQTSLTLLRCRKTSDGDSVLVNLALDVRSITVEDAEGVVAVGLFDEPESGQLSSASTGLRTRGPSLLLWRLFSNE